MAAHRKFDNPHAVQGALKGRRRGEDKPKVDRGWEQGSVGRGVKVWVDGGGGERLLVFCVCVCVVIGWWSVRPGAGLAEAPRFGGALM